MPEQASAPTRPQSHRFERLAVPSIGLAVVLWGSSAVVVKKAALPPLILAFHRCWTAAIIFGVLLYLSGGRVTWRGLRASFVGGVVYAANICLFFASVQHTTVANATMIGSLQPLLVMLVAWPLFGERVSSREIRWAFVALGGVTLVIFGSSGTPAWSPGGDLLATAALFTWTVYFVVSKQVRRVLDGLEYQTCLLIVSAAVLLPVTAFVRHSIDPGPATAWWGILGVVATAGVGHLIMNWAHPWVPITTSSLLTLANPVVSIAGVALVLGEHVNPVQVGGMVVVLGSLAAVAVGGRSRLRPPQLAKAPAVDNSVCASGRQLP